MKVELESFREDFKKYGEMVYGTRDAADMEALQTELRRIAPKVTDIVVKVVGDRGYGERGRGVAPFSDLLVAGLAGGNNAMPHNFRFFDSAVTSALDQAIGTIEAGLWPPSTPPPILLIRDTELQKRCADLLAAPENHDRVIREATTVLEDRLRSRPPHQVLARLIPHSGDQIGENLVNRLCAPDNPIVSVSDDRTKRIAFHKMLTGVFAYLRHPYHHRLDAETEWSWAWSIVGLVDQLLFEVEQSVVTALSDGQRP